MSFIIYPPESHLRYPAPCDGGSLSLDEAELVADFIASKNGVCFNPETYKELRRRGLDRSDVNYALGTLGGGGFTTYGIEDGCLLYRCDSQAFREWRYNGAMSLAEANIYFGKGAE